MPQFSTTDTSMTNTTTTMTTTTMTTVAIVVVVFYDIRKCRIRLHSGFENVTTIDYPRGVDSSCENRSVEAKNGTLTRNAPPFLERLVPPPTN